MAVFTLSVLLVVWTALALPRSAVAADDTAVAREHAQKGKAFMDLGKYTDAASEYEAAYATKPDPALLLNLAQAYRLAGNADKALFFYRKYLQYVPKSPYRADIEEKIAALEKQSKGGGAPASPPAADTTTPPAPPASPPTSGYPPPGSPAPGPYSGAPAYGQGQDGNPAGAPPYATPPPSGEGGLATATPAENHGQTLKLAGLITGGAGVLSIVVGAVFGAQASDAAKKIEQAAANGDVYDPDLQAQDSRGRSAQTKEAAFLVIGVAALGAGGFLYYYGSRQQHAAEAGTVAILPAASASQLGAAVKVTF